MRLPKVLIADPSEDLRYLLADILQGYGDVMTAATGPEALRLLASFCPQVLILDTRLPGLDGISLLYRATTQPLPAVLALTTYASDYLLRSFGRTGVDHAMLKPFDMDALISRVLDLAESNGSSARGPCHDILLQLGMRPRWRGFPYLLEAVSLAQQDPDQAITKELYPAVAKCFRASAAQVERDIRTAIHNAWSRCPEAVWRSCLRIPPSDPIPRPSNATFIFHLARLLREDPAKNTIFFPEKNK